MNTLAKSILLILLTVFLLHIYGCTKSKTAVKTSPTPQVAAPHTDNGSKPASGIKNPPNKTDTHIIITSGKNTDNTDKPQKTTEYVPKLDPKVDPKLDPKFDPNHDPNVDKRNAQRSVNKVSTAENNINSNASDTFSTPPKASLRSNHHPPIITKPKSKLEFPNLNSTIILEAGKRSKFVVAVKNSGEDTEKDIEIRLSGLEGKNILKANEEFYKIIDTIQPGKTINVTFNIETDPGITDSTQKLIILLCSGNKNVPISREITATCRSKEETLYADIIKKERNPSGDLIDLCREYTETYQNGKHQKQITNILENTRWRNVQKVYAEAVKGATQLNTAIETIEHLYLSHYNLSGKYSQNCARMFHQLRDFHKACGADTFDTYECFTEKYGSHDLAMTAKQRTTLKYWRGRYNTDPNNPHIWCQLARATVAEKGTLGFAEAEKLYLNVIDVDKNNQSAYIGLGYILKSRNDWNRCLQYLYRNHPPGTENHRIYYILGHAYERKDDQTTACAFYSKAVEHIRQEMNKKEMEITRTPYLSDQEKSRAISELKKNPEYLDYLYYRGLIYREFLDFDNAKQDFRKIIAIAPDSRQAKSATIYLKGM